LKIVSNSLSLILNALYIEYKPDNTLPRYF